MPDDTIIHTYGHANQLRACASSLPASDQCWTFSPLLQLSSVHANDECRLDRTAAATRAGQRTQAAWPWPVHDTVCKATRCSLSFRTPLSFVLCVLSASHHAAPPLFSFSAMMSSLWPPSLPHKATISMFSPFLFSHIDVWLRGHLFSRCAYHHSHLTPSSSCHHSFVFEFTVLKQPWHFIIPSVHWPPTSIQMHPIKRRIN